ncbi:MAG TPA: carboxypeptidase-like regulatory domain-containing protein [Acetobacteraceae bacterium]|nr:carboxypeptidase-like regulatory domain-containing protein [Acetobacteraceae bacterium]
MSWRSRWVIVPTLLVLIVLLWNAYVWTHAGGVVAGLVVDGDGRPVPSAEVILYARSFLTNDERARTRTDQAGQFRFTGNASHALQLQAEAPGLGRSQRVTVRLLFRGEDVELAAPLRLTGSAS